MIFAYGYACCVFKHNISGDHPKVPEGMPNYLDPLPPEFFLNLGCPLSKWLLRPQRPKHSERSGQGTHGDCCPRGPEQTLIPLFPSSICNFFFVKGPYSATTTCVLFGHHWRFKEMHLFVYFFYCLLLFLIPTPLALL